MSKKKPKVTCLRCLDLFSQGDVWHWERRLGSPPAKAQDGCQMYSSPDGPRPLCELEGLTV